MEERRMGISVALSVGLVLALVAGCRGVGTTRHGPAGGQDFFPSFREGKGLGCHSFDGNFVQGEKSPLRLWKFMERAMAASDLETDKDVVRLTNAEQSQHGLVYNEAPLFAREFEVYFDFKLKLAPRQPGADGFVFFALSKPPTIGTVYGLTDAFEGLVIAVDTYSNSKHQKVPYLYAMLGDGTPRWDPINDGTDQQLTKGCYVNARYDNRIYVRMLAGQLKVAVGTSKYKSARPCFTAENVNLNNNTGVYLGFAAATGDHYEEHEISRFHTRVPHLYPDVDIDDVMYEAEDGMSVYEAYKEMFEEEMEDYEYDDSYDDDDDDDWDDDEDDEDYDDYDYDEDYYDDEDDDDDHHEEHAEGETGQHHEHAHGHHHHHNHEHHNQHQGHEHHQHHHDQQQGQEHQVDQSGGEHQVDQSGGEHQVDQSGGEHQAHHHHHHHHHHHQPPVQEQPNVDHEAVPGDGQQQQHHHHHHHHHGHHHGHGQQQDGVSQEDHQHHEHQHGHHQGHHHHGHHHHGHHHHGHHHHGQHHGVGKAHFHAIGQNFDSLKETMVEMMREAAPDPAVYKETIKIVRDDLLLLMEVIEDTDLSFDEMEDVADDLEHTGDMITKVTSLKESIGKVEGDLMKVESVCVQADRSLQEVQDLLTSATGHMMDSLGGGAVAFWIFAVASQVLVGLVFAYVYQQESSKSMGKRGGRSTFGRLV